MRDFRTPVMTRVEASWEDPSGAVQTIPACMEDKSAGGACIRVKTPIVAGSKLRIQWRFEQFSGIAKYCRSEGKEYLVGVQRDATNIPFPSQTVPTEVSPKKSVASIDPPASTAKIQGLPKPQESKPNEIRAVERKAELVPVIRSASSITTPVRGIDHEIDNRDGIRISPLRDFESLRRSELQMKQPSKAKESGKERKPMARKWFELTPRRNQPEELSVSGQGSSNDAGSGEKENPMSQLDTPMKKAPVQSSREVPTFQVELSSMEDIYRAAGIMIPPKGYTIKKVVEMLNSEHIRGLSKDMKRAAVLMALDAAGVPIDQVQRDAKVRQDALDSFEAGQKKQVEAEWARKAEEIVQIQAELESVKAHYMARISRNLEGVAREKATFGSWQAIKQDETQSMSEAVELCLKSQVSEAPSAPSFPSPEVSLVKTSAKTV